ncbi:MAG TPA: ATP-dependent zinc protease [Coxiellaceae bacterium]|nr:ATP-dependent zinc protease [Coxiellaceae bacterium]
MLTRKRTGRSKPLMVVGWREWAGLPTLHVPFIKAKIDTGARTSVLHAFQLEHYRHKLRDKVRFYIHPIQRNDHKMIRCTAEVIDKRWVTDSGGHREYRYVIKTDIQLGAHVWPIEMTLTDRECMRFRMLLGRTALQNHIIVDPGRSYLVSKEIARAQKVKK